MIYTVRVFLKSGVEIRYNTLKDKAFQIKNEFTRCLKSYGGNALLEQSDDNMGYVFVVSEIAALFIEEKCD